MAEKERALIDAHLRTLKPNQRRARINCGRAWVAAPKDTLVARWPLTVRINKGDIVLRNPRVFHGAPPGTPDVVGWDMVTITPEMIGQRVAIFVGEEFKTGRLRLTRVQRLFRDCLLRMGGRFREMR